MKKLASRLTLGVEHNLNIDAFFTSESCQYICMAHHHIALKFHLFIVIKHLLWIKLEDNFIVAKFTKVKYLGVSH